MFIKEPFSLKCHYGNIILVFESCSHSGKSGVQVKQGISVCVISLELDVTS